jgi:hypothetical protein
MAKNIQKFYTQAAARDFARLFQFRVRNFQIRNRNLLTEDDLIYVESASLPGRTINNVPVPFMGLSFNVPGTATYPGSTGYALTFRCDASYEIRDRLESASFAAFSDETTSGDYRLPGPDSMLVLDLLTPGTAGLGVNGVPVTSLPSAIKGSPEPTVVRSYQLFGVYVASIADTNYTVTDTGTIATVQANLAYQFWRPGKVNP